MTTNVEKVSSAPRGAELFSEIEDILAQFGKLGKDEVLRCATITDLLSNFWDAFQSKLDKDDVRSRYNFHSALKELYNRCRLTDVSTACGVFIVASNIEAAYLDDADAKLVHSLTLLHIHRARALTKAKAVAPR
jgi:hypothetical protein